MFDNMMVLDYRGYKFKGMRNSNVCLPIACVAQRQTMPSCNAFQRGIVTPTV
jgi:hypothetical protein